MTDHLICIDAGTHAGLATDLRQHLRDMALDCTVLKESWAVTKKLRILARHDLLISLFPDGGDARTCLGLAAGLGMPTMVLHGKGRNSQYPAGTKVFTTLQALTRELAKGQTAKPHNRLVTERTLQRLNACEDGLDWFRQRYPQGGNVRDWTRDEQVDGLKAGGGRWLGMAFDHGLLRHWPMDKADFENADLDGLALAGARMAQAVLRNASMVASRWRGGVFDGADLTGTNLSQAVLFDCTLTAAKLERASLEGATLRSVTMDRADLQAAVLAGARIAHSSFKGATLTGARLAGAALENVDLSGARLDGADLGGARLHRCNLDGASLRNADLRRAIIHQCRHEGADMTGATTDGLYLGD